MRRCAGCRQVAVRTSLVRLVCDELGRVRVDPRRRAPGRGLNVHDDRRCVGRATAQRVLARAFRRPGPFDLAAVGPLIAGGSGSR